MKDLYFEVVRGVGNFVKDGVVSPYDFYLPEDLKESNKNEFSLYVYGQVINPKNAKSHFSKSRDLISKIHFHFAGFNRKFREAHLNNACSVVDKIFGDKPQSSIIVIDDFILAKDEDENIDLLLSSLYNIIMSTTLNYGYAFSPYTVICIYVNKEQLQFIKKRDKLGGDYTIDEDNGLIIIYNYKEMRC